jgi:hypothetical protein
MYPLHEQGAGRFLEDDSAEKEQVAFSTVWDHLERVVDID